MAPRERRYLPPWFRRRLSRKFYVDARDAYGIIAHVGATIASSMVLEDVLSTVVGQVGVALDVCSCDLHDYSPDTGQLRFVANWQRDAESRELAAHYGATLSPSEWPSLVRVVEDAEVVEVHIDDPLLPPKEREQMERWQQQATLDAPLVFGGEVIGVLGLVEKRRARRFTGEERDLFSRLAVLAAIAIHNARTFHRQEEQNRHLTCLLDASRALASATEPDRVLATIAIKGVQALGSNRCAVYEQDPGSDTFTRRVLHQSAGGSPSDLPERWPDDALPSLRALLHTDEVVVEHLSDPLLDGATRSWLEDCGEMTRLSVPLSFKGRLLGIMVLGETDAERRFTAAELDLAKALGEQAAAAVQDVRMRRSLQEQAITDGLTGLYNHRFFYRRLGDEVARAQRYLRPLSILMIDIDDFKQFNDSYGHQTGDAALRAVADVLKKGLRHDIDIPARYGGEEFVVILPDTPLVGAEAAGTRLVGQVRDLVSLIAPGNRQPAHQGTVHLAESESSAVTVSERLRQEIQAEKVATSKSSWTSITVSIGVATCDIHRDNPDSLVASADAALYEAKADGKNRVCVAS